MTATLSPLGNNGSLTIAHPGDPGEPLYFKSSRAHARTWHVIRVHRTYKTQGRAPGLVTSHIYFAECGTRRAHYYTTVANALPEGAGADLCVHCRNIAAGHIPPSYKLRAMREALEEIRGLACFRDADGNQVSVSGYASEVMPYLHQIEDLAADVLAMATRPSSAKGASCDD
jgi:hypothetical protein